MKEACNKPTLTIPQEYSSGANHDYDWLNLVCPVDDMDNLQQGKICHMDLGFPRSQKFNMKDEFGRLATSIDGNQAYLLIIDQKHNIYG